MSFRRFTAALSELRLDLNLRVIRRRERRALARLGVAAAAAGPQESTEHRSLFRWSCSADSVAERCFATR